MPKFMQINEFGQSGYVFISYKNIKSINVILLDTTVCVRLSPGEYHARNSFSLCLCTNKHLLS